MTNVSSLRILCTKNTKNNTRTIFIDFLKGTKILGSQLFPNQGLIYYSATY